jgi:hypothetical protein
VVLVFSVICVFRRELLCSPYMECVRVVRRATKCGVEGRGEIDSIIREMNYFFVIL